jgi:hypothetical protein
MDSDIEAEVAGLLPKDRPSTLSDLRRLYERNHDAVFRLVTQELDAGAGIDVRGFQTLCRVLSVLMRDGFRIESRANAHIAMGNRGGYLVLEDSSDDKAFLEALYSGGARKIDFQGRPATRACLDFFLSEFVWDDAIRKMRLLRVAPDDANALVAGSPRYQQHSLVDCAREVIRSPYKVWRGLRNDGPLKGKGWAYCGIPSRSWSKEGERRESPAGFTFIVFTDDDGFVFDWDWVKSDPVDNSLPADFTDRFERPEADAAPCELVLGNVKHDVSVPFDPTRAWFSARGDCVFCYFEEAESFSAREDEYLTAFYSLSKPKECVGFKLKVVSRYVRTVRDWAERDEGIKVEFDRDKVRVDVRFLMRAWLSAKLVQSAELGDAMRLMQKAEKRRFDPILVPMSEAA